MLGFLGLVFAGFPETRRVGLVELGFASPYSADAQGKAQELIEAFNARLLHGPTATSVLETWCAEHQLASDPIIRARLVNGAQKPISAEQRKRLQISDTEPVSYRRVALTCGDHILSEADNWYVPARLTSAMNDILATSDKPFGRVVEDLKPIRETFSVEFLWHPRLDDPPKEVARAEEPGESDANLFIPPLVLRHSALVYAADHKPFAEVHEAYTKAILGFGFEAP